MYFTIDEELLKKLISLQLLNTLISFTKSTCAKNVNEIIVMEKFQILQKDITAVTGMQPQMTNVA